MHPSVLSPSLKIIYGKTDENQVFECSNRKSVLVSFPCCLFWRKSQQALADAVTQEKQQHRRCPEALQVEMKKKYQKLRQSPTNK